MNEQPAAGWYPDGNGDVRYWNGAAWTEHLWASQNGGSGTEVQKKEGAFDKISGRVKKASADRKAAKEEVARKQAQDAMRAGALMTSGVFGTSTVEIYENGYVRVASWEEEASQSGIKSIDKKSPYEKLRSIKFNPPGQGQSSGEPSALTSTLGTAVTGLLKGGKALAISNPAGLVVSATTYIASAAVGRSLLIITTDKKIHTLTNQSAKSMGIKVSHRDHNNVSHLLEAAGNDVLGPGTSSARELSQRGAQAAVQSFAASQPVSAPTLADRLRELAGLHSEGILSEEEFASAKAKLLGGL